MRSTSYMDDMFSLPKISGAWLLLGFFGLGGASGCLYNSADRCDPGQSYDPGSGLCICAAGTNTVTGDHGCVPCGEHEVATNDVCTCADGYQMPAGGSTCVIIPKGLGDSCKADAECTDATYNSCHLDGDTGYCTNANCSTSDDCTGGYACNTNSAPSFCQRPPTGQGMSCSSDADCAGTEATY
ncbi:MAG TPA: hypothetical protein VNW92_28915, partial [Polyangiaceae bacterium]|nr:hypothetical protein [Polyangiaceae bacterium]